MTRHSVLLTIAFALACTEAAAPESKLPAVPTTPIATPRTGEIVVSWQDLSDNETGFRVEVRTADGPWLLLAQASANTTNVTHPNVLHQVQYFYRIAACNDAGCSEFVETSAKWQTGAPPVITSVSVPLLRADNATFRASVRTGGSDTHVIFAYRKVGAQFIVSVGPVTVPGGPNSEDLDTNIRFADITAYGLEPDTEYTVSVTATNVVGSSLTGEPIPFRTKSVMPVVIDDFRVIFHPGFIIHLAVTLDQLGLETQVIGEITQADADFSSPFVVQAQTLAPRIGTYSVFLIYRDLVSGQDYKARMILRNAHGTVVTPVRTFRAP